MSYLQVLKTNFTNRNLVINSRRILHPGWRSNEQEERKTDHWTTPSGLEVKDPRKDLKTQRPTSKHQTTHLIHVIQLSLRNQKGQNRACLQNRGDQPKLNKTTLILLLIQKPACLQNQGHQPKPNKTMIIHLLIQTQKTRFQKQHNRQRTIHNHQHNIPQLKQLLHHQ